MRPRPGGLHPDGDGIGTFVLASLPTQPNTQICAPQLMSAEGLAAAPNGGSARGYQDPARAVSAPTNAVLQAVQTVCLCVIALSVNVRICRGRCAASDLAILPMYEC
jgi:hypothetical protein